MRLKKLLQENQEGCSFQKSHYIDNDYSLVLYKRGYFVALTDNQVLKASKRDINKLDSLAYSLRLKRFYYGYWKNDNIDVLDLAIHVSGKSTAIELCKTFKQKAYYDCYKKDSIFI